MAGEEISVAALALLAAPAADDVLPIYDVSAGQLMRVRRDALNGGILTGGGTVATGGYTLTLNASGVAAVLTAPAGAAGRVRRTCATGSFSGAGPFDIDYSAIAADLDLPTSFSSVGFFDIELWIVGTAQTGYGVLKVVAYKSGSAFGGAGLAGSQLSGSLAPAVTVSVVGGALRLAVTGNSAITILQYRIVG